MCCCKKNKKIKSYNRYNKKNRNGDSKNYTAHDDIGKPNYHNRRFMSGYENEEGDPYYCNGIFA